jgi:cell division protease FtsH
VRHIVLGCYASTVELVRQHRACMDRLVELLIEKESLDGEELRAIVSEFATIPEKERFSPFLGDDNKDSEKILTPSDAIN